MKPATEPDVIVIGAGAGGAACAWSLARQGVRVTVLEAGRWYDPFADYRLHRQDWERGLFPLSSRNTLKYTFGTMQPLEQRYDHLRSWNHISGKLNPAGRRRGWRYHHVLGVGGSTLHFSGEAHRFNPRSMAMHTRFEVAADWPITYQELEPYYGIAEQAIGVAGSDDDTRCPRSQPYPLPAHAPGYASRYLIQGLERLGLGWTPNSLAILSRPYEGRPQCNYCANCNRGCPRWDKGTADVTFMRKALATGRCRLLTEATVLKLRTRRDDRVGEVLYRDHNGSQQRLTARVVVLAAGAVATPRLLLLSGSNGEGLGNESGQVGKHFMETLYWTTAGLHPKPLDSYRGLPSDIICWDYNGPDAISDIPGGCRFSPTTAEANLIGPINYAQRVVPGWGRQHKQRMRESFGRALAIGAVGESLPNPYSYVDLDPEVKDAQGLPVVRIHSRLDETEIKRLDFMADKCRQILQAAGVGEFFEEYGTYDYFSATHVFGTCRMGVDPATSVVNGEGRSHRWRNLYIADASVFPSSGGGESPSLTIEALAIRTGDRIRAALQGRET